jgi:hypothetical protein
MDTHDLAARTNHFVHRGNGVMQRVDRVDERFVQLTVLMPLQSHWAMATAEYDATWASRFVPVDMGAMPIPPQYRPPVEQGAWDDPVLPAEAIRGDEGPEGVVIGDGSIAGY